MQSALPPWLIWPIALLAGLSLGSFLNVVITRLPVMLMRHWRAEARAALSMEDERHEPFNLMRPGSLCPRCKSPIAWRHKIPVISWLLLKGRCASCEAPISAQYPLVELAGGAFTLAVVLLFGISWEAIFLLGACLTLLALAVIDLRLQLLPDILTLPLLWAGLYYQWLLHPAFLADAVMGAMLGYLLLWSFHFVFQRITGKQGMGHGDFKLMAALGAWLGWPGLPLVLLISAAGGSIYGIAIQWRDPEQRGSAIPFGPWLAMAGWIMLLAGDTLMRWYLQWMT